MEHEESKLRCDKIDQGGKIGWSIWEDGKNVEWVYIKNTRNKYRELFSSPIRNFFKEVFLPQGFPDSVHPDYVSYQIWDTVQAFASTILGTLTTHSIMRGVGVGESTATPLAAAITWILKDGTGMIGRILFAWWNGPELDSQCKKWRLFADVLNDLAMGLELLLPYFSLYSTVILCFSSGMKSLVGVAGGATRAAITQHQALNNNLADVSAKDGSQETCVNLIASLVGVFILSYLNPSSFIGIYYGVLVAVHIYANYSAVRSLCFDTFNEDRLAITVKEYLTRSMILSPDEINRRESVLLFHKPSKEMCGFNIVIGESIEKFVRTLRTDNEKASIMTRALGNFHMERSFRMARKDIKMSLDLTLPDVKNRTLYIAIYHDSKKNDIINAYVKAFLYGCYLSMKLNLRQDIIQEAKTTLGPLSILYREAIKSGKNETTDNDVKKLIGNEMAKWTNLLERSEWKLDTNLLSIGAYRSYDDLTVLLY